MSDTAPAPAPAPERRSSATPVLDAARDAREHIKERRAERQSRREDVKARYLEEFDGARARVKDPVERCIRACPPSNSPPPCLMVCFWSACEDNERCRSVGACGREVSDETRKRLMYSAALVTLIGMLLSMISVLGLAKHHAGPIRSCAWAVGEMAEQGGVKHRVYVGLRSFVDEATSASTGAVINTTIVQWSSQRCTRLLDGKSCTDCRDAALATVIPAFMSVVTAIPQLTTDLVRSLPDQDVRCQKAFGIGTGLWGFFSTLASFNAFGLSCRRSLDDLPGQSWVPGPGAICGVVAVVFKLYDILIHAIVPVPDPPLSHLRLAPKHSRPHSSTKQEMSRNAVTKGGTGGGGADVVPASASSSAAAATAITATAAAGGVRVDKEAAAAGDAPAAAAPRSG